MVTKGVDATVVTGSKPAIGHSDLAPASGALVHQPRRYDYIDSMRALAVIGVITSHTVQQFPQIPYHVRAVAQLGANGVQTFFVVSALTLMLSWHVRGKTDPMPVISFYVRRLFRIAPMFWLGLVFYAALHLLWQQFWWEGVFNPASIIMTLFFVHAWTPGSINSVVPGGWSIGVEMCFYVVFPFVAMSLTNLRRATLGLLLMVALSAVMNDLCIRMWVGDADPLARSFLVYWLPNQLPSFALGFVACYVIGQMPRVRGLPPLLLIVAACVCMITAFGSLPFFGTLQQPIARGTMVAIATFLVTVSLSQRRYRVLVNSIMRHVGKVSFSAYLVHFIIVELARQSIVPPMVTGMVAVGWFGVTLVLVVVATIALSTITYRLVEAPMIALGNRVLEQHLLAKAMRQAALS